jgi:lipid-binding SYLF domain-containing protein
MRISLLLFSLLCTAFAFYGCAKPKGNTPVSQRAYILQMRDNTLAEIYQKDPYMQDLVQHAAGYGVFSNINTQLLILGSGNGYGVITDNSNGKTTFMRMAQGGVGLGVALTDFRELIIFNNPAVMRQFISSGWDFGVQGDAVLKSKTKGSAASGQVPFDSDIIIYQLTKQGIALRTNVGAEKYWIDSDLNYY